MMHLSQKEILADGLMLLTALIWGSAFAVVKNTLDSFPPAAIIAMRYAIATVLTGIAFRKHLRGLTRADVARGALVGLLGVRGTAYVPSVMAPFLANEGHAVQFAVCMLAAMAVAFVVTVVANRVPLNTKE